MASNDFIIDLVEKLAEENIEYVLITIQKGKDEHKANAYFNITTMDGADMILTTVDHVFSNVDESQSPDRLELDRRDDDPDDDFNEDVD
jgi:hypothetical protein|tara:strand:- start:297 stop:563 length:267 start_codon:yes stop_codon:yes gene_type:complete